jgi:dTDP-4-dehydrorhamnose 3,5-epimerase
MDIKEERIAGIQSIQPKVFGDERGFFIETFNEDKYAVFAAGFTFKQDNLSKSRKGVLRGLHFQLPPFDQGKLVSVIQGSVLDVVVDIRKESPTYGQHFSIVLTGELKNQLWIPPGFAHGFVSLEDDTLFSYKCTNVYAPSFEQTILWNDPILNIDWKIENPIISEKDKVGLPFNNFVSPF